MGTKRLLCREAGGYLVAGLFGPLLGLVIFGCGSGEATPPRDFPAINRDRYEQVRVAVDGRPVDANTTITAGRDFVVTVSFRRLHVWPGMNNPESYMDALLLKTSDGQTVIRKDSSIRTFSEKDGLLTFSGKVESLPETGVLGLWIQESVTTETPGLERYYLFAANIRSVKQ